MNYSVSIDIKQLPIQQRNKIVDLVKKTRAYYKLENQIISMDFKTAYVVFMEVGNVNLS